MHSSHSIGAVGDRVGHPKRESPPQDVDTVQARILGERQYADASEEAATKRRWAEIGNNLDGSDRDFEFKPADSETVAATFPQYTRDKREDNSISVAPASPDLVKSLVTEGSSSLFKFSQKSS